MEFEEWFRRELPRLLRLATVLSGKPDAAQDLVQEVVIRVQQRWVKVCGLDHRDAYVRRMLVNQFRSYRRKSSRLVLRATVEPVDRDAGPDFTDQDADRQALRKELERLPPRQRAVVVLRYFDDADDETIGRILGCRPSTVRSQAARALKALRISPLTDDRADARQGNLFDLETVTQRSRSLGRHRSKARRTSVRTEAELRRALNELANTAPDPASATSRIHMSGTATRSGGEADRVSVWRSAAWRPASLILAICVVAVLAVGVVAVLLPRPVPQPVPEPAGPRLEPLYQGTVTIEPSTARPGEWVTLTFPEAGHGTNFTLETWTGSGWELSYYLVAYSMSGNGSMKSWWAAGDPGGAFPQPFGMPIERVIVPPVAAVGVYRLCQVEHGTPAPGSSLPPTRRACGLLTVT